MTLRNLSILIALLVVLSQVMAADYCPNIPYERAEADTPVLSGYAQLPTHISKNIIAQVVSYNQNQYPKIPIDVANPRLHTHIWVVNKDKCEILLKLPIPSEAKINVYAVAVDTNALPIISLPNKSLEFKYVFSDPAHPRMAIIRKIIINEQWKIINQEDITIKLDSDAEASVLLADWSADGKILLLAEFQFDADIYNHYILRFNKENTLLFRYQLRHPEAHITANAILFDETRIANSAKYPSFLLMTAFDKKMKYYRQYSIKHSKSKKNYPKYIFPRQQQTKTYFQYGNIIFDAMGIIILSNLNITDNIQENIKQVANKPSLKQKKLILPDYLSENYLKANTITSYIWKNKKWMRAPQFQPKHLLATDLLNSNVDWNKP